MHLIGASAWVISVWVGEFAEETHPQFMETLQVLLDQTLDRFAALRADNLSAHLAVLE